LYENETSLSSLTHRGGATSVVSCSSMKWRKQLGFLLLKQKVTYLMNAFTYITLTCWFKQRHPVQAVWTVWGGFPPWKQ